MCKGQRGDYTTFYNHCQHALNQVSPTIWKDGISKFDRDMSQLNTERKKMYRRKYGSPNGFEQNM